MRKTAKYLSFVTLLFLGIFILSLPAGIHSQEKAEDDASLKNPELIQKFLPSEKEDPGEYFTINLLVAGISGAAFGYVSSYSMITNADYKKYQGLYTGGFALGAMGVSAIFSGIEIYSDRYYFYSKPLFRHSWLGFIIGSLVGTSYSVIPYSESKNTDDVLQYLGYGAMAGTGLGLLSGMVYPVFFQDMKFNAYYDPTMNRGVFSFTRQF